jgi:hypothetical protein
MWDDWNVRVVHDSAPRRRRRHSISGPDAALDRQAIHFKFSDLVVMSTAHCSLVAGSAGNDKCIKFSACVMRAVLLRAVLYMEEEYHTGAVTTISKSKVA